MSGQKHGPPMASSVVRLRSRDGAIVGAGFLIADDTVLTCAHVVSDALEQLRDSAVEAGAEVGLDLPFAVGHPHGTAKVVHWVPVREDQGGDVAVLRLHAPLPGARPLPMADVGDVWDHRTRAVGFTDDAPDGNWQQGRLRGPVGSSLVQLSRADGQTVHVRPGFSGSPVWDEVLGVAVGMVVASQPVREAQQAFVMRTEALSREVPGLREMLLPAKPFLGLQPFGEDAEDVFFGRDSDIDRVVTALKGDHPVVTLCGPSGSGKSSLALAGVLPRVRRADWEIVVVDCSGVGVPRAALATEIFERATGGPGPARAENADRVESWLTELGLLDAFHRATGRTAKRLLVVLDQAEALLGLPEPDLAETLALLFPPRRNGLRVLATWRADVINTALKHPGLAPVLTSGVTLPLSPMTRDQLHTVITRPLTRAPGVTYDPGLDLRILDDAGTDPGVLPLLGFVLEQLWERQRGGRLSSATYQEIGGVKGALRQHARRVWDNCVPTAGSEGEARRLLAGLVRVVPSGEVVLRRALTRQEAGEGRWRLVQAMAAKEHRLLVLHGGEGRPESAELAHEALITQWPELAEVVRVDADFLNARADVQHDLERWEAMGRRPDLLPGGFQLGSLTKRLHGREAELDEKQTEFLESARRRQGRFRWRIRAGWTAGALVLALIATLITFNVLESRDSARRADEARSRALSVQSDELVDTNPGHAALAAVAAYETEPTQEARNALLRRYTENRHLTWSMSGAEGKFEDAAMSADGRVTLVTTEGGRALLFLRTAQGRVRQESLRLQPNVKSPRVSFDGRRIAYLSADDGVIVWHDVTPAAKRMVGQAHTLEAPDPVPEGNERISQFKVAAFSRDGRYVVESGDDGWTTGVFDHPEFPVRVWDLETGRPLSLPKKYSIATAAWFGPDNHTLVLESASRSLIAVDIRTGKMRRLTDAPDTVSNRAEGGSWVSADGTVALSCRDRVEDDAPMVTRYKAIRVADGRLLRDYRGNDSWGCETTLLDASGKRFARGTNYDIKWEVLETSGNARPRKFVGPEIDFRASAPFPLLGTDDAPVVTALRETTAIGQKLVSSEGETAYGVPQLLGDGSTMLVRTGKQGRKLVVAETEGENRVLSEVSSTFRTPPATTQLLTLNRAQTLMADVSDVNRVTVRRLPSLEKVSEFTVVRPPSQQEKEGREPVSLVFQPDGRLVSLSGTQIEHWNISEGRRLRAPIDLENLRLTSREKPGYFVDRHRVPGVISVQAIGEPNLYAVDLRTGRERRDLRLTFGEELLRAIFLEDSRYLAVLTTGRIVELWSAEQGRAPRRVVGPFGPLEPRGFAVGNPAGADFFVAYGSTAVFLRADDPSYRDTYKFGTEQNFVATNTKDGKALLGAPEEGAGALTLTPLDPAVWKRHLCKILGRGLSHDERSALVGPVPEDICSS
ncbi:nSTAND1 domain-containing NTPase [Streptomyces parvus]|uniref:nSTAND1 domain-containing NTPase n=1 Tax=Streptomyces parvus TaxID=66428 RepID=UPI002100A4E8|nr:trypsin-like peptidase domain-containing protein [Streptomyces parvus]MCQ1579824.1 trypsin-like peptidase domain-containing protein [Streptomyces parvus]